MYIKNTSVFFDLRLFCLFCFVLSHFFCFTVLHLTFYFFCVILKIWLIKFRSLHWIQSYSG
uniref:Uncharacterized protein n=1 Tax=Siphoviridae sp. ctgaY24 TaxID=2827911 RepID=A0A8S5SBD0_9CAUD|nr:MAG TPA: hypothetical protein [Siphoviridae sp. ctgaY24]